MIKINLGWFLGTAFALYMSYRIWGSNGLWFTIGLSLQTSKLYLTLGRKV